MDILLKYFLALLLTLLLHISLYYYLNQKNIINIDTPSIKTNNNTHISYVKLQKKTISNVRKKKKLVKEERKKITKKVIKKKKFIAKKLPKPILKVKKQLVQKRKNRAKKVIKKNKIVKEQLKQSYLKKEKTLDKQTKKFIDLYGKEYENFDIKTKLFLQKNIKNIGTITQRYLQYPYLSVQANQSGINIVQFYLYPNGEISHLKIIKSSKYFLLDDNTIQTIQEAYKDYPVPSQKTLIKIFVKYKLR